MVIDALYREFSDVKRDVEFLNSLDRPSGDSLQSELGALLVWSKEGVGTTAETIVVRLDTIVDVYGYIAFVFASDTSSSYYANIGIHGPSVSQAIVLTNPGASNFNLFIDGGNTLKLQKTSGTDAFVVNGFFFIL